MMKVSPLFVSLSLLISLSTLGCSSEEPAMVPAEPTAAADGHDHSGWWCPEHGVPEEICTRCDATLVAEFKAKGDWCDEHELPDSQCFICHPEHQERFAAQYVAKYGKEPPALTE